MEDYSKRFITNDPLREGQCKSDVCYKPTYNELKSHTTKDNCWIGINGKIYDITKYKQAFKTKSNKKLKIMEMEYNDEKNVILSDNTQYDVCTIDDTLTSSRICEFKSSSGNYLTDNELENTCNNSNANKVTTNELKKNCYNLKSKYDFLKYNNLGLLCGKHYDNVNEKNIFFPDVDHNDFVIGEIKHYRLYKLINLLLNILVIVAIFYIIKYKMNNNYIVTYVLLPLILYILYSAYKYTEIYFDRHIKHKKIQNKIYKNHVKKTTSNNFSIDKVRDILQEIEQRLIAKLLLLGLIVLIIIYGLYNNMSNIIIMITLLSLIFLYFFYFAFINRLYRDYKPRFIAPTSLI